MQGRPVSSMKSHGTRMRGGGERTHLDEDEHLISRFFDLLDLVANVVMGAHLVIDLSLRP